MKMNVVEVARMVIDCFQGLESETMLRFLRLSIIKVI